MMDYAGQGWSRNVQPAAAKPAEIDAALVERMVALTRRIAGGFYLHAVNEAGIGTTDAVVQAQSIVRELPEPVDPDLLEARECAAQSQVTTVSESTRAGGMDDQPIVRAALAAIKRGRQLEREAK